MNSVLGYDELVPRPHMRRVVLRLMIESKIREVRALGLIRVIFKVALNLGYFQGIGISQVLLYLLRLKLARVWGKCCRLGLL